MIFNEGIKGNNILKYGVLNFLNKGNFEFITLLLGWIEERRKAGKESV